MPRIQSFRGLRYAEDAGRPDDLVGPPYDVIDDALRAELAARSPHNVVHLTLPLPKDPAEPETRYAAGAETLAAWRESGVLVPEDAPAVYVLTQRYLLPDGRETVRTGLMTRMRLHDFDEGIVLPHERTLSGPLEDRIKLTKATNAQLEPIFLVFSDKDGAAREILAKAAATPAVMTAKTDDGVVHGLHALTEPADVEKLSAVLADERAVIADGHHRYSTALAYRDHVGADREGPHQYVLSFICPLEDEGLVILPTHRLVHDLPDFDPAAFLARAGRIFGVTKLDADASTEAGANAVIAALEAAGRDGHALATVTPDGAAHLLTLGRDVVPAEGAEALPDHPAYRQLDVAVLHGLVMQHLLGMSRESQEKKEHLEYFKSTEKALSAIRAGKGQMLFLMNATPMEHVREAAEAGLKMPQKSTYFFPKLPSGMVFNAMDL